MVKTDQSQLDNGLTKPLLTKQDTGKSSTVSPSKNRRESMRFSSLTHWSSHSEWQPSLDAPTLLVVFSLPDKKEEKHEAWSFLKDACIATFKSSGLLVKPFETEEDSSLQGRDVVALGADFKTLLKQAYVKGMPKRYDWDGTVSWTPFDMQDVEQGVLSIQSSFLGLSDPNAESDFFTESEILILLRDLAYAGILPFDYKLTKDAGVDVHDLACLCECQSTLKIAEHAGVVETVMCLHTGMGERLRSDFTTAAKRGPLMHIHGLSLQVSQWDVSAKTHKQLYMDLPGFQAYLGDGLTGYFLFMRIYCRWTLVLAFVGVLCFGLHHLQALSILDLRESFANTHSVWYGIVVTIWTTLFVEKMKRSRAELDYRSGHSAYDHGNYMIQPLEFVLSETALRTLKVKGNIESGNKIELEVKKHQTVGMKYCCDGVRVKIDEITDDGAIVRWNRMQPKPKQIRKGDYVYSINGTQGSLEDLLHELNEVINKKSRSISSVTIEKRTEPKSTKERNVIRYLAPMIGTFLLFGVTGIVICALVWLNYLDVFQKGNIIMQNVPLILYIIVTTVLEPFYGQVCQWLTRQEGHLLYSEFIKSLIMKTAVFQLVNWYAWFWYLAFWAQDFGELRKQLIIFMTGQQVGNKLGDTGLAFLKKCLRKTRNKSTQSMTAEDKFLHKVEEQWNLDESDLSAEYQEMAIVFGAVTMFATVFPLGGLLALLQSWWEMYNDSYKKFKLGRRGLPNTGFNEAVTETWMSILEVMSYATVVFNTLLLALAWPGHFSVLTWVLIEHGLLGIKAYLAWSIPDRPEWVMRDEIEVEHAIRIRQSNHAVKGQQSFLGSIVANLPFGLGGASKSPQHQQHQQQKLLMGQL